MPSPRALALLAAAATLIASPSAAQAWPDPVFHIEAQEAGHALMALCLSAGCTFAFVAAPERDYRTNAVHGAMDWRTAVRRLLAGTGLRYRIVDARAVTVWADAPPPQARAAPPVVAETAAEVAPVIVLAPFSGGIEAALAQKRRAAMILDSVSAARIGELPAANVAEALQRIPGVAIEREVGEGQFVSVRGLGPLFQSVTLNGAPVAFNENIRNSTQSGRQFRFRALSADLLAGATLAKSATADTVDGGIGSNIDIRTVRGLDGAPFLAARIDGRLDARSGALSPDLAVSGRWRRADGQIGLVGGVSTEARQVQYDRFQIQRYRDVVLGGQTVTVPNDLRTTIEREDRQRISAFLGVEWRATPDLVVDLDTLVSRFDNAIREDRIIYDLGERVATPALTPGSARITKGVLTAATITDGQISNNTEFSDQSHDNLSTSLGLRLRAGGWRLEPRISYSLARSGLDTPLQRIAATSAPGVAYGFDLGADPIADHRIPRLETTFALTDPAAISLSRYGLRAINVEDHDLTALMAAERPIEVAVAGLTVTRLMLGAQASDRGRDYQRRDREASPRPGASLTPDYFGVAMPGNVFGALIDQRDGPWTAADFDRFRRAFVVAGEFDGVRPQAGDLTPTGTDLQSSYRVGERVAAVYGRLDFETRLAGRPASGNLGLRLVAARTDVAGAILAVSATGALEARPLDHRASNAVALPSANLAVELGAGRVLRLAASRSITRPSLADLRLATVPASALVSAIYERGQTEVDHPSPGSIFNGVGGNPALTPYLASNYDLSLEWYFRGFGALTLAAFHKDIDDYVVVSPQMERLVFATRDGPPVTASVLMSRPRNAGRARVTGLETGFSRRWNTGLGLWASATLVDAASRNLQTGERTDLQGVSRLSYSISPFFERGPLAAHLSWTWRSSFLSGADLQGGGVSTFVVGAAGVLDFAGSYDLGPSTTLFIEASNLTDTVETAYEGLTSRPLQLGRAGRSFGVGVKMKL